MFEISKPFIIRPNGKPKDYVVDPEHELFNITKEKRVQFVQGANTFVGVALCSDYSYLVIAYLAGNFFWVMTSFYGFSSIDTRQTNQIRKFYNLLIFVLVIRIIVYGMMAYIMDQYQNVFSLHQTIPVNTDSKDLKEEVRELVCTNVYQPGLMLIQCIMETAFLIMMIYLAKQIRDYVESNNKSYQQDSSYQKKLKPMSILNDEDMFFYHDYQNCNLILNLFMIGETVGVQDDEKHNSNSVTKIKSQEFDCGNFFLKIPQSESSSRPKELLPYSFSQLDPLLISSNELTFPLVEESLKIIPTNNVPEQCLNEIQDGLVQSQIFNDIPKILSLNMIEQNDKEYYYNLEGRNHQEICTLNQQIKKPLSRMRSSLINQNIPEVEIIQYIINSTQQNNQRYADKIQQSIGSSSSIESLQQENCLPVPYPPEIHENVRCSSWKVKMPLMPHIYQRSSIQDDRMSYSNAQGNFRQDDIISDFPMNQAISFNLNGISDQQSHYYKSLSATPNQSFSNEDFISNHVDELMVIIKEYLDKLSHGKIYNEFVYTTPKQSFNYDNTSIQIQQFDEFDQYSRTKKKLVMHDTLQKIIRRTFEQLLFSQNFIVISPINKFRNTKLDHISSEGLREYSFEDLNLWKRDTNIGDQNLKEIESKSKQEIDSLNQEIEIWKIKCEILDCRMMEFYDNEQKAKKKEQVYQKEIKELQKGILAHEKNKKLSTSIQQTANEVLIFELEIKSLTNRNKNLQDELEEQIKSFFQFKQKSGEEQQSIYEQMESQIQSLQKESKSNIAQNINYKKQIFDQEKQLNEANNEIESIKKKCALLSNQTEKKRFNNISPINEKQSGIVLTDTIQCQQFQQFVDKTQRIPFVQDELIQENLKYASFLSIRAQNRLCDLLKSQNGKKQRSSSANQLDSIQLIQTNKLFNDIKVKLISSGQELKLLENNSQTITKLPPNGRPPNNFKHKINASEKSSPSPVNLQQVNSNNSIKEISGIENLNKISQFLKLQKYSQKKRSHSNDCGKEDQFINSGQIYDTHIQKVEKHKKSSEILDLSRFVRSFQEIDQEKRYFSDQNS